MLPGTKQTVALTDRGRACLAERSLLRNPPKPEKGEGNGGAGMTRKSALLTPLPRRSIESRASGSTTNVPPNLKGWKPERSPITELRVSRALTETLDVIKTGEYGDGQGRRVLIPGIFARRFALLRSSAEP